MLRFLKYNTNNTNSKHNIKKLNYEIKVLKGRASKRHKQVVIIDTLGQILQKSKFVFMSLLNMIISLSLL